MPESGRNFRERGQHEIALQHARMWNLQLRQINCFVAVEKNIDIEQARPFRKFFFAAKLRFDLRLPMTAEGGALVTADGELIGMAVYGPRRRVLAIPAATISRVMQTIKDKGHVVRGYLGVSLQSVPLPHRDGEQRRRAAMVVTIDPAGPAQAGGLLQGDILVAMDGEPVTGPRGIYQRLGPDSVGRKISVELVRAGVPATAQVTIAARSHG